MSVIARIDNTKQLSIVGNIVEYPSVLESAGRNLIPNSNFSKDVLDGWASPYGTHQIKNSFYIATLTSVHASASRAEYYTDTLEPGIYTFSMLAKSEKGFRYDKLDGTEYEPKHIEGGQGFKISYITFEVTEPQQVYIRMYFNNPEVGDTMEIDWVKLEKGSIPTPCTPAPEDLGLIYPDNVQYFSFGFKSNGDLYTNQVIKSPSQFSMKNDGVTNSITVSEITENAVLS